MSQQEEDNNPSRSLIKGKGKQIFQDNDDDGGDPILDDLTLEGMPGTHPTIQRYLEDHAKTYEPPTTTPAASTTELTDPPRFEGNPFDDEDPELQTAIQESQLDILNRAGESSTAGPATGYMQEFTEQRDGFSKEEPRVHLEVCLKEKETWEALSKRFGEEYNELWPLVSQVMLLGKLPPDYDPKTLFDELDTMRDAYTAS